MNHFTLDDLGEVISSRAVLGYLAERHWQTRCDNRGIVCVGPPDDDGRPIVKILPTDETCSDFPLRLEELVSTLSVLEGRPAINIAREMARAGGAAQRTRDSLADELVDELHHSSISLPEADRERAVEQLRPLLANAELAFQGPHHQGALLASRLAEMIPVGDSAKLVIWRLCDRVVTTAGWRMRLSPSELDEFYAVARASDPTAPDDLLQWIGEHTTRVDYQPRGEGANANEERSERSP